MKTLANCDNIEFMQQTFRIFDDVKDYLTETKLLEIRKKMPDTKGMSKEEEAEAIKKQVTANITEMLKTALMDNAEQTLRILGLICFCEDEKVLKSDRKIMTEAVAALCDENVLDFFISVMQSLTKISRIM